MPNIIAKKSFLGFEIIDINQFSDLLKEKKLTLIFAVLHKKV